MAQLYKIVLDEIQKKKLKLQSFSFEKKISVFPFATVNSIKLLLRSEYLILNMSVIWDILH